MSLTRYLPALILSLAVMAPQAQASICQLPSAWKSLNSSEARVAVSTGDYDPVLDSGSRPQSGDLDAFEHWVTSQVDVNPWHLMTEAMSFFGSVGLKHVIRPFYSGEKGKIQRISCLDSLLLVEHLKRSPYQEVNSEFQAWVLFKGFGSEKQYRIYFVSDDESGAIASPTQVIRQIYQDVSQKGWRYQYHIHLHPFNFNQRFGTGNLGALPVPSTHDVRSYRYWMTHPQTPLDAAEYRVTNGFDTVHITPQEAKSIQLPQDAWINRAPYSRGPSASSHHHSH